MPRVLARAASSVVCVTAEQPPCLGDFWPACDLTWRESSNRSPTPKAAVPPGPTVGPPARRPPPAAPAKTTDENSTPAQAASLSEARVRVLHQAYIDARKQTNASAVSFEKLERSLRETEAKLKSTHKGRNVDFEVVIKDGKAILKPKLK